MGMRWLRRGRKHGRASGLSDSWPVFGTRPGQTGYRVGLMLMVFTAALADGPGAVGQDAEALAVSPAWLTQVIRTAQQSSSTVVRGQDGWLYPVSELRALSVGRFWGPDAAAVSRAAKPESADPLAAILDFQQQLNRAGLQLIVVPVPAKSVIYPEPLAQTEAPIRWSDSGSMQGSRLDRWQREFYDVLRQAGVDVLDLVPQFQKERLGAGGLLYCRTDSHWTPRGSRLAADAVTAKIGNADWLRQMVRRDSVIQEGAIKVRGDLADLQPGVPSESESVPVMSVTTAAGQPVSAVDRSSPVVVLGDSHTLIFHDPEMFGSASGFVDFLSLGLRIPVDLVGVRGSGATTTRIELLRRRDRMAGKRVVIWCFSFREFTESETGWRKVPVIPLQ